MPRSTLNEHIIQTVDRTIWAEPNYCLFTAAFFFLAAQNLHLNIFKFILKLTDTNVGPYS